MTPKPLRVLIVEDSATDAKLVAQALRQTNRVIDFLRVEDEVSMRRELETASWDLIISDWSMPKFNALTALAVMKGMELDLPFIIVSGTIGEETAVAAMRAGAHDYVLKDKLARLAPVVEREVRESKIREERRQAAKALLESEARYRRIVETTSEGVWVIDAGGKTTFMNARMAQMLGCDVNRGIGRSPSEFLDDKDNAALTTYLRLASMGIANQVEVRFLHNDGTSVSALLEATPVFDAARHYEGSLAMVMDISERKRSEAARRASESRFKCLWESGIILIAISDTGDKIIEINDAGLELLGYARDELLAQPIYWDDLTPPESRRADETARAQLMSRGIASPWEKELIRKDGRRVSILAAAAILDDSVRIVIGVDLTERKRAEQNLQERMRVAALTADIALVLTHEDALERILQRCVGSLAEHLDIDFVRIWTIEAPNNVLVLQATAGGRGNQLQAPLGAHLGEAEAGHVVRTREPYLTNDMPLDSRGGDVSMAAFAGYPLLVDGELVGVVGLFSREPLSEVTGNGLGSLANTIAVGIQRNNVTRANVQLEAQLRQAQKMEAVGRLAGGVAHDFNNILSVILSSADFIGSDAKAGDSIRDDAHEIYKAAMRAAGLTRQLLMFSRQQVLAPKVLDLDEVLENMDKMLRRILGEDVEFAIRRNARLGRVRVDPSSIDQVIMNLVVNARDAMPTGGKLTIETTNVVLDESFVHQHPGANLGPHVMLTVSDTGTGMDQATQQRIFEPFFTTKQVGKGTGLGLSTVLGIVQQSQGVIRVDSEPGKGTTFNIYLPRVDDVLEADRANHPNSTLHGSETILLVEDEDQVRMAAQSLLERNGYQVIEMSSPGEALLYSETNPQPIDLLLTDVVMPQMSGPELARRLALTRPKMKVLCMSGYADDSIVRHGVFESEIAFFQKPFTPDTLMRKVREVLDA